MKYKVKENEYKDSSALFRVLCNRGIEDPVHYLQSSVDDVINPATIRNILEAARIIISHVAQEHDIWMMVDQDCDGFTSAAAMINYLYKLFPAFTLNHVSWSFHSGKQHGIDMAQVNPEAKLILIADASSEEFDKHKELKESGKDVVIIDHHNCSDYSPYAIVVNNQLDSNYSNKTLSGAGMVYKVCSYIDRVLGINYADDLLDLVALGIIADVMLLTEYETHYLIQKGLANLQNPYVKAMVAKNEYSIGDHVTPTGIAWYVAPAVNAVTRMGTAEEKQILFESMLSFKAYTQIPSTKRGHKIGETETIVEQACRICNNVKNRQNKLRDAEVEEIESLIFQNHLLDNKILFIQLDHPTENSKSITGLIANKLMSTYGHPVMLLNKTFDEETGELTWSGSGRNNPTAGVESLQDLARESGCFTLAQGHDNALGLSIPDSSVQKFLDWSNNRLQNCDFTPTYEVDVEYLPGKVDSAEILELADAKDLWGQGIDEPLIALKNVYITKDNINLYNTTLKLSIPNTNVSVVKFKSSQEEYDSLYPNEGCTIVDIIGTCKRNTGWDNSPEIIIIDYDIVRKQEYYF